MANYGNDFLDILGEVSVIFLGSFLCGLCLIFLILICSYVFFKVKIKYFLPKRAKYHPKDFQALVNKLGDGLVWRKVSIPVLLSKDISSPERTKMILLYLGDSFWLYTEGKLNITYRVYFLFMPGGNRKLVFDRVCRDMIFESGVEIENLSEIQSKSPKLDYLVRMVVWAIY